MKKGQYHYTPCGRQFRIYICTEANEQGNSSSPVYSEPFFNDREQARKRVYELNGWNYTPKP